MRAVPLRPESRSEAVLRQALACVEVELDEGGRAVGGNALDVALCNSPAAAAVLADAPVLATLPFDHERRLASVLVADAAGAVTLVTKGAPESVLARCRAVRPRPRRSWSGNSARAIASLRSRAGRCAPPLGWHRPTSATSTRWACWSSSTPPKPDAPDALRRLAELGITVKVLTGDNPIVATKVCRDLGLPAGPPLTGTAIDALDDDQLAAAVADATVFAGSALSRRLGSSAATGEPAPTVPSSATASTTRSHCTPPTWASRSTRPRTWPRTPRPTSSCCARTSTSSPTASPRAGGSSPTR